ncbi:right-handed parallel beta-helix repeat-containing protein [Cohnella sp. GCM10027633]|uniref:right-handed parallel beta-helix repeat-containing protein n=1 Tax=unclassified Cohnella TaxID=2636738 RepID=UPI00363F4C27
MPDKSVINVKTDYGAVGDGVANDTAPLLKAIQEAIRRQGATIYLPSGTYRTAPIEATGSFGIVGDGDTSVLYSEDRSKSVLKVNSATGVSFSNFKIRSNGTSYSQRNSAQYGFFLYKGERCLLQHLTVENTCAAGLFIFTCKNTKVAYNHVKNTLADGIHVTGSSKDCVVIGNTLADTGDDGIAVVSYQKDKDYCERIMIIGNGVYNSWARGIAHVGGKNVTIADNIVTNSASSGILVVEDTNYQTYKSYDTVIHHNQITKAGNYTPPRQMSGNKIGIEIATGSIGVEIDGNFVKESWSTGISITTDSPGVAVRGNTVNGGQETGIQILGTDKIVVADNVVEKNKKYGLYATGVAYGTFVGNHWINNNFYDMASPGTGTPSADVQAIDNANFGSCKDCTISNNVSVDDRTDRATARVERAIEVGGSTRMKLSGNQCYVYNADPNRVQTREALLDGNTDCERIDIYTGTETPTSRIFRAGQLYFKKDSKELFVYDGSKWRKCTLSS